MLDVMQFYVSGFWIWLGLTIGLGLIIQGILIIAGALLERKHK
jgi:hypothetical protein